MDVERLSEIFAATPLATKVAHLQRVEPEALSVEVLEDAFDSRWDLRRRHDEHERPTLQSRSEIPRDQLSVDDLALVDLSIAAERRANEVFECHGIIVAAPAQVRTQDRVSELVKRLSPEARRVVKELRDNLTGVRVALFLHLNQADLAHVIDEDQIGVTRGET